MNAQRRPRRGFTVLEVLVVMVVVGLLAIIVMPKAGKALRRARAISAISDLNRVLTQARLSAIKNGFQVVAKFDMVPDTHQVRVTVWEDRNPDDLLGTYTPPGGGAAQPEQVLQTFVSQTTFRAWKHGGTVDDYAAAVAFNTYGGDNSLRGLIVFLPTGAIQPPEDTGSGLPTATDGRGIYIADEKGINYFRLTIPGNYVAKVRVEKWLDSGAYSPIDWTWN